MGWSEITVDISIIYDFNFTPSLYCILIENSIFDDVTAKITSVPQVGMEDDATAHLTYRNVRLCLYCVGHSWLTFVQGWKFALWYFEQSALLFFVSEIAK